MLILFVQCSLKPNQVLVSDYFDEKNYWALLYFASQI